MLYLRLDNNALYAARHTENDEWQTGYYILTPGTDINTSIQRARTAIPFLAEDEKQVEVIVAAPFTFIPLSTFEEKDATSHFRYCYADWKKDDRVMYDVIPEAGAALVFAVGNDMCQAIEGLFPDAHFMCAASVWLRHNMQKVAGEKERRMFINIHAQSSEIAVIKDGHLLVCNTYTTPALPDLLYYAMCIAKRTAMKLTDDIVYIMGNNEQRTAATTEFRKFISHVTPVLPATEFPRNAIAKHSEIPFDLMALTTIKH